MLPLDLCVFQNELMCSFPCRRCLLRHKCILGKGCMGCVHPERRNKPGCSRVVEDELAAKKAAREK